MPDESIRRELARSALEAGKVPAGSAARGLGRPGRRQPCAICGVPIHPDEVEFELGFSRDGSVPGFDMFHMHIRCFAAWEFERTKIAPAS